MTKRAERLFKILGDNVRTLRLGKNLSQEELAFRAGLDRTYVSQIERGVSNPSVLKLIHIADTLGVEVPELLMKR